MGKGTSASVYRGIDAVTLQIVALKEILITEPLKRDMLQMELKALEGSRKSLDKGDWAGERSCILGYYGAFLDAENNNAYMVMEYMENGSVEDVVKLLWKVKEEGGLGEDVYRKWVVNVGRDLFGGMRDFHR